MSENGTMSTASGPAQEPARKGFLARVIGVFVSPGETFEDVARRPTVLAPLLLILIVQALVTYMIMPAQGEDTATLLETSSSPFFQRLTEEQRAQAIEQQRNPSPARRISGAVIGPIFVLAVLLIVALIFWGLGNLLGGEPTFKRVLSMLAFAAMITIVANWLVKLPLVVSKNTVAGVTFSPAMFMPDLEVTSSTFRLLRIFDIFAIWGTVVTGIGLAKVSKISTAKGVVTAVIFTGLLSAVGYLISGFFS